ncbi:MAG: ASCH domain-containing protein [Micrococcaceae bacterium]
MTESLTLDDFWQQCHAVLPDLPTLRPEAWAFGATPEHADGLLELVLAGVKTATSSPLWDYEHTGEPVPAVGEFSIILDGSGAPRALLETTEIAVVPFAEVSEEHAYAEGEHDRTLASWRAIHERFWREHSENPRGYAPEMPVVCERFQVRYPLSATGSA